MQSSSIVYTAAARSSKACTLTFNWLQALHHLQALLMLQVVRQANLRVFIDILRSINVQYCLPRPEGGCAAESTEVNTWVVSCTLRLLQ